MNRIAMLVVLFFTTFLTVLHAQSGDSSSLLDNFKDGDTSNVWGGAWEVFKGGVADNINFEMTDEDGYGRTKGCMHVTGKYSAFGGVVGWLDSTKTPVDLTDQFDGISFAAKAVNGSTVKTRIRVRELKAEASRGYAYFKYDFTPTEEWILYNIPWDSLQVQYGDPDPAFDISDLTAVDVAAAAASEVVNIYVDDIIFWKGTPPTEIPTDDFQSVFDDFEDADSANSWGGTWEVFKGGVADNINFEMTDEDGYGASKGAMKVNGKFSAYGGVAGWLDSAGTAVSLERDFDGISFAAKAVNGSTVKARVRVRELKAETDRGYAYFKYDFVPAEEWTLYNIPWDSLEVQYGDPIPPFDATDINAVDFAAATASEAVNIIVDDVIFWRGTPPAAIPTTDTLVLFDDFEDVDTSNAWDGAWEVFKGGVADNIDFEMMSGDGYDGSSGFMKVSGKFSAYGGVVGWLDASKTHVNLKHIFDGISFAAKAADGSQTKARVRIRELKAETERGYAYFKYDFVPTETWTLYNIPWDSLEVQYGEPVPAFDITDLTAIDFAAAAASEVVNIYVDNIYFWRGAAPEVTGIKEIESASLTLEYDLSQNYPNPFNPTTNIRFSIPKEGLYTLKIFNILGEEVAALLNEKIAPGKFEVKFDASNLPSGVYIYKLSGNKISIAKKMMLVK